MRYLIGLLLSAGMMILLMPKFITYLKSRNINQVTSEYALQEFKEKEKTPIMGGLLFVVVPIIVYVIIYFKGLADRRLLFVLLSYVLYCSVGFIDDCLVISSHSNEGLSPITRLVMEFGYALILFIVFRDVIPMQVTIPFLKISIPLRWYIFVPFMLLLYMAEANAVNFTDGMDGLCAGVSFIGLVAFFILSLICRQHSIALFIACIMGGLLGYLKFNFKPAKIFMGDSGSLALGALFASLGIVLDQTIALFFIGGIFVVEMACVLIQQISVRVFHKRVFSYTPIHYAYVIKGVPETKVVEGFYLAEMIVALIGLLLGINTL